MLKRGALVALVITLMAPVSHAGQGSFTLTAFTDSNCLILDPASTPNPLSGDVGACLAFQPISLNLVCQSDNSFLGSFYSGTSCSGTTLATLFGPMSVLNTCQKLPSNLGGGYVKLTMTNPCGTPGTKGCFSSESTVRLDTGAVVSYSAVKIGDHVLSMSSDGVAFYDKVFRITHHSATDVAEFIQLTTSAGQVLELTPTHMMHTATCCDLATVIVAADIKVGDVVFTASEAGASPVAVTVASVTVVQRAGVYNVHTLGGRIVVNDVIASHFTGESTWGANARSLAPVWYRLVDMGSYVLGAEDASVVTAQTPSLRK